MYSVSSSMISRVRHLLRRLNVKPSRRLGQNFVVCEGLLDDMVSYASVSSDDVVLEIGAGLGFLTERLAERAAKVIAVELDRRLVEFLCFRFRNSRNVEVVSGDFLDLELPRFDKVVSNVPFSISSPLTFKLAEYGGFDCAVLTYQKEFAERMVASVGSKCYGRLTVTVNFFFNVMLLGSVSRSCFYPSPDVDAAVVKLVPKGRRCLSDFDLFFLWLVSFLFSQRNRKVRNAVLTYCRSKGLSRDEWTNLLENLPLREIRVRDLGLDDFLRLASFLRGWLSDG